MTAFEMLRGNGRKELQNTSYEYSTFYEFVKTYKQTIEKLKEFCLRDFSFNSDELDVVCELVDYCQLDFNKIKVSSNEQEKLFNEINSTFTKLINIIKNNLMDSKIITGTDCLSFIKDLIKIEKSILLLRSLIWNISTEKKILKEDMLFIQNIDIGKEENKKTAIENKEENKKTAIENKEENKEENKKTAIENNKSIVQIQNLSTNENFYLNLNESNLKMLKWLEEKGIFKNADVEITFDYELIIEEF